MIDRVQPVSHTYNDLRSDVIQELLARADDRGYVTYEDLVEVMAEDLDETSVDALLEDLEELGIEVRNQNEREDFGQLQAEETDGDSESEEPVADINAVSADDPVGLYFRQMAQEPLLTAAEEIDLGAQEA
jgi:RNA polymerase primary sigma factor